jgi:hypothetical protein
MYTPERFMTLELVEQVLRERTWPVPYTLEDCDPDGVAMDFEGGTVVFDEGFDGSVRVKLLAGDTGLPWNITLSDVIVALRAADLAPPPPRLIADSSPYSSLEKVRNGLRDQATLLLTYLPGYFVGDRSWIEIVRPHVVPIEKGKT